MSDPAKTYRRIRFSFVFGGQPVLVNTETREVFGPMNIFEPSDSCGTMICRAAVKEMIRGKTFTDQEQEFIRKFVALSPA
jgi:hypothetical protein